MALLTHGPVTFGQQLPVQFDLKRMSPSHETVSSPEKKPDHALQDSVVGTKVQKMVMTSRRNSEAVTVDLN